MQVNVEIQEYEQVWYLLNSFRQNRVSGRDPKTAVTSFCNTFWLFEKKKKRSPLPYMLCHCPSVLALAPAIHSYCQLISTVPQLTTVLTCPETKLQCILVPFSLASDILHATLMHFKKKKKRLGGRIRTYYACTVESSSLGLSRSESWPVKTATSVRESHFPSGPEVRFGRAAQALAAALRGPHRSGITYMSAVVGRVRAYSVHRRSRRLGAGRVSPGLTPTRYKVSTHMVSHLIIMM